MGRNLRLAEVLNLFLTTQWIISTNGPGSGFITSSEIVSNNIASTWFYPYYRYYGNGTRLGKSFGAGRYLICEQDLGDWSGTEI